MTTKRFTYNEFEDCIIDNVTNKTYWGLDDILNNKLNELHEENKELKAQLLYDGDSICNICEHQYLIKTGKYYVARCKKEHEECSKEDIKYCENFELVRGYK